MTTQHTSGPWIVERDGFTLTMGHQVVATALAPDRASVNEQRANARLIAAAPEMLALLTAKLVCKPDCGHVWCGDVRALLANIEGKG